MVHERQPILQPRAEASAIELAGGEIAIRLRHEDTDGEFALIENVIPVHFDGPPPHVHQDFSETFYVLSGALRFRVGAEDITATPGTVVYVPGAVPHTFSNLGADPATVLLWVTPAGHERYFEGLASLVAETEGAWPSRDALANLMSEHGIEPAQLP